MLRDGASEGSLLDGARESLIEFEIAYHALVLGRARPPDVSAYLERHGFGPSASESRVRAAGDRLVRGGRLARMPNGDYVVTERGATEVTHLKGILARMTPEAASRLAESMPEGRMPKPQGDGSRPLGGDGGATGP